MIVRRPSASKLGHALHAPYNLWLPQRPDTGDKSKAEKGTRIHSGLERWILSGRWEEAAYCVRETEREELRLAISGLPDPKDCEPIEGMPSCETECWYHPLSLMVQLGVVTDAPPLGYYRGRTDRICRYRGRLTVMDWKTGNPAWQTAPDISAQCYFFARFLQLHPLTAEEVAKDGVDMLIYLTQRAGSEDHDERFLTAPTYTHLLDQFGDRVQDLEMLLAGIESGRVTPPPHDAAKCGRFCRCDLSQEVARGQ